MDVDGTMEDSKVILLGSNHVYNISDKLVKLFSELDPDIICVELDIARYRSKITDYNENIAPFWMKQFSKMQEAIARKNGITSGEEFLIAIYFSQAHNIPFAFIDIDQKTILLESKKCSLIDQAFIVFSTLSIRFLIFFLGKKGANLAMDNSTDDKILFPFFLHFIRDERNQFMAKKLEEIVKNYRIVVAVVGLKHLKGMSSILESNHIEVRTINLIES